MDGEFKFMHYMKKKNRTNLQANNFDEAENLQYTPQF